MPVIIDSPAEGKEVEYREITIAKPSIKPKPKKGEMVKVHYTGMLLNGEVFE